MGFAHARPKGGMTGSLRSLINDHVLYNEANLYVLYDKFLVALSAQKKRWQTKVSVIWMLKLFLSSNLPEKWGIFVTLPRSDVQKGATAFMKESNESRLMICILLLSEISWGAVL